MASVQKLTVKKMGWVDNLESDLSASNNQTDPSGINTNATETITTDPVEEFKQEVSREKIDNHVKIEGKDNRDEKKEKEEEPPAIVFAERVTIAGLEEAFKEKWKPARYMYRVALLLAAMMIIFQSCAIIRQYQNMNITLSVNMSLLSSPIYLMTTLYEKAQQKAIEEKNLFLHLLPSCSSYLSNCVYNRISFDCCATAEYLSIVQQSCYQINLSNVSNTENKMEKNETFSADPIRLNETGFSVDVKNNWNFGIWDERGSASDGFYIFVDKIPMMTDDPTIIPSNMDATIILSQPMAVKEKSQCRANEEKSTLQWFGYYDSYGIYCRTEALISFFSNNLGCQFPILSYILPDSCGLRQLTVVAFGATQAIDDINQSKDTTRSTKNLSKRGEDNHKASSSGLNNICLPLCSRWSYKILSASYGSIKYQDKLEKDFEASNQSWSRIRFVMPWTTTVEHKEEFVAKGYLAFCDIGGMMGVYAEFSVITFVQLAYYGGNWFAKRKRKQNKVSPAEK